MYNMRSPLQSKQRLLAPAAPTAAPRSPLTEALLAHFNRYPSVLVPLTSAEVDTGIMQQSCDAEGHIYKDTASGSMV